MSMKLITEPPWSEPPMFMCCSVGKMRQMALPGPSGLNSSRPVAAAKLPRGKSPQLYQPSLSGSGAGPGGAAAREIDEGGAGVQGEGVLERVEPIAGGFVAAVGKPAICLEQDRGAEEA